MKNIHRILCAAMLFLATGGATNAEPSEIGNRAVETYIIPGYAALVESASDQQIAMQRLCTTPDAVNLSAARTKFTDLVTAWSRMEIIRFGPILGDNRLDRILFWPDRRGIALRQIQALLVEQDVAALQPDNLRQKSIALQGLGSLEYVLFGSGADELLAPDTYRCALGTTIAGAIHTTATEVLTAWQEENGIAEHMANPVPENADYRTNGEVLSELLGVFIHGFELIRDVRLGPVTAFDGHDPTPRVALYRRSELTIEAAEANISGMKDLFEMSGIESALADDMVWVAGAMQFEFENFQATADQVANLPIETAVADEEAQSRLGYLRIVTQSLQDMAAQQIAVSLGLSAGFSSLDGD